MDSIEAPFFLGPGLGAAVSNNSAASRRRRCASQRVCAATVADQLRWVRRVKQCLSADPRRGLLPAIGVHRLAGSSIAFRTAAAKVAAFASFKACSWLGLRK